MILGGVILGICGDMFWGIVGGEVRGWEGVFFLFIGIYLFVGRKVNDEFIVKYLILGYLKKIRFRF